MSDLAQLMQIAPNTAASYVGQNQAQSVQMELLKQKELAQLMQMHQQQMSQSDQMNPLLLEQQRLNNTAQANRNPGLAAASDLERQRATVGAGTMDTDILAKNATNKDTVTKSQMDQMDRYGKMLSTMGPMLAQIPADPSSAGQIAPRHSAAMSMLQQAGLDFNSPQGQSFSKMIGSVPPDKLPDMLNAMGKQLIDQSASYREKMDVESRRATSNEKVAGIHAGSNERIAQANIDAGKFDRNKISASFEGQVAQLIQKTGGDPIKMYGVYTIAAQQAQAAGISDLALKYAQSAQAIQATAQARNDAGKVPGVDAPAMSGLPAAKTPQIQSSSNDAILNPNGASPVALPAGQSQVAPPAAAINMLKGNPALRAQFDAKYGAGASAKVLGQ